MYDFNAFQRLDAPNSLGATASGASFATSTGDVLEVSCFGPGVFRLRLGPNTRPDYGIVVGRVKPCAVTQAGPDRWTFTAGVTDYDTGQPVPADQMAARVFRQKCVDQLSDVVGRMFYDVATTDILF